MRSIFCQPYEEEFAKNCIAKAFPELKWDLLRVESDPPDLADVNKEISVEVVRAVTQGDAEFQNTFVQYKGKNIEEVPDKLRKRVETESRKFVCNHENEIDGVFVLKNDLYGQIKKCILKKTESLNSNRYSPFALDCIFIYHSGGFCFEKGLIELMNEVEAACKEYKRQFKRIFIYCDHEVFLCNQEEKSVLCKHLIDDEIEELKKESLTSLERTAEYNEKSNFLKGQSKIFSD